MSTRKSIEYRCQASLRHVLTIKYPFNDAEAATIRPTHDDDAYLELKMQRECSNIGTSDSSMLSAVPLVKLNSNYQESRLSKIERAPKNTIGIHTHVCTWPSLTPPNIKAVTNDTSMSDTTTSSQRHTFKHAASAMAKLTDFVLGKIPHQPL